MSDGSVYVMIVSVAVAFMDGYLIGKYWDRR